MLIVQQGTTFTQDEITMLEEFYFIFRERWKCPPWNLFSSESIVFMYQPLNTIFWPIWWFRTFQLSN
jgi:hypothetical protein